MRIFLPVLLMTFISTPVFAQQSETLTLYPKSREAYQARSDERAEKYQAEGYNYIENLYEYRAEGGASSEPRMTEAEADAAIESVNKQGTTPETNATSSAPNQ